MFRLRREQIISLIYLAAALAAGAVARFWEISKASIWHDEGYSLMLAPLGPIEIVMRTARDVHPPLYYLLLHYWLQLFGSSELAARSLSVACSLATIVVVFVLIRRLIGTTTARVAVVLAALAPFLVRYAQEARMYALVALLLTLATYLLVKAQQDSWRPGWYLYGLVMALAFYTHYYSLFILVVHWLYVAVSTPAWSRRHRVINQGLWQPHWWSANATWLLLFAPWVPAAYGQFTRVQSAFWIPAVNQLTLPQTLSQFLTFTSNLSGLDQVWLYGASGLLLTAIAAGYWFNRRQWRSLLLLTALALFAPLAVFGLSFARPIYVDRYFVFAAVGFYALLAALITLRPWARWRWLPPLLTLACLAIFGLGLANVGNQRGHQMRMVAAAVNQRFDPGDVVVAGELYVYFDFSYYNRTGETLKLLAPEGVTGYGETSLLYDRAAEIVVRDLRQLRSASGYAWIIGKTGRHDYFDRVPANWQAVGPSYEAGYSAAQRYQIGAPRGRTAYLVE